jgi:hypothetical protein
MNKYSKEEKKAYDRKRYLKKRTEIIAQTTEYHKNHEEKLRLSKFKWDLKVTFNLSFEIYCQMFEDQKGLCKICKIKILKGPIKGTKKDTCHVDHDHITGKVRGLLCRLCNNGLGNFRDSIDSLSKAIEYLRSNND